LAFQQHSKKSKLKPFGILTPFKKIQIKINYTHFGILTAFEKIQIKINNTNFGILTALITSILKKLYPFWHFNSIKKINI
jgi:hypothetical protein